MERRIIQEFTEDPQSLGMICMREGMTVGTFWWKLASSVDEFQFNRLFVKWYDAVSSEQLTPLYK